MTDIDSLKAKADSRNRKAIAELERRGFQFLVHFGTENAADRLWIMNAEMERSELYGCMNFDFGIRVNGGTNV